MRVEFPNFSFVMRIPNRVVPVGDVECAVRAPVDAGHHRPAEDEPLVHHFEIRAGRRGDQQVAVFLGRTHPQSRFGRDDERPQIQRLFTARRGHPGTVQSDELTQGFDE